MYIDRPCTSNRNLISVLKRQFINDFRTSLPQKNLDWQFVECMEEIRSRKEYTSPIYLHEFEWQCRDQLANGLPDDLKDYYLPLIH